MEWRTAAFLSQDPIMMQEIHDGIDQHTETCISLMELPFSEENRVSAKAFNFRMIYADEDKSWYGFFMDSNMPSFSRNKWKDLVIGFYNKYNGLREQHFKDVQEVSKKGFLRGPTGRLWYFHKESKKGGYLDYSTNKIYNYPIQGTAGDIIKVATIEIRKRLPKEILIIMFVHDSIVFDTPPEYLDLIAEVCLQVFSDIPKYMKKYFNINWNVPIKGAVEFGNSWGGTKKYESSRT